MTDSQSLLIPLVDKMPAFPQAVSRVLELTAKPDCSPKELVSVIEHDPVMTMKILKLVNSAYFGLSKPINSINHAVVFIGINTIKNLALSIAAIGMLPEKNSAGLDTREFLLHSLGVATIAKLLAPRVGASDREAADYFIAGLLHDFGKVVFAQFMAEPYRQALERAHDGSVPLHTAEREAIGADHSELGGLLGESWQLPPLLVGSIRHHHDPDQDGDWAPIRDCVFAANQIARSMTFGDSGNRVTEPLPEAMAQRLGGDLDQLIADLGDLSPELEKARLFLQF